MSYYELLKYKAMLCRHASRMAEDFQMKEIWENKANKLEEMAGNLPLVKAHGRS